MAKRSSSRRQLSFSEQDKNMICELCHCYNSQLSSPSAWKDEQARTYVLSLKVPLACCICRPCRDDVRRVLANPNHVPRWKKGKNSSNSSNCCVLGCSSVTLSAVSNTSQAELQHAFQRTGLQCSSEVIPTPTPLCKHHYHLVYSAVQPRECATCGVRLRGNNHHPCPKPDVIRKHLKESTGFEGEIHSQDRVCMTCYKSHLVVLKENKSISRDSDLEKLISTYTEQIPSIDEVITAHDVMKTAMARTVVRVGHILPKKQAILLPSVHNIFMSHARDLLKVKHIGCEEVEHVSSRWVLSDLTANLQHHIAYSCKVRKYGTLIYRPNADLVSLLSEAMWKLQNAETVPDETTEVTFSTDSSTTDSSTTDSLDDLNKLIHTQISTFLAKDSHSPFEHDELNFDNIIEQIHPKLWNAICLLTRSTSERRGTSKVTDPQSIAYHTKRARRLFLLCTILFCTDDRCSMPLHTLLTDTVESQGGSALLVQILNRLGVCASADTLSRFIQYKVTKGDKPDIKPDTFTVISADNIDFLHSFARVYCGHQTSIWHGTTVQAAQPLPSLSLPDTMVSSLAGMCIDPLPTSSVDLTCSSVDPPTSVC